MEVTLRVVDEKLGLVTDPVVLILVLMEDTLREHLCCLQVTVSRVLILVLMEDTLRVEPDGRVAVFNDRS